MTTSFRSIRVAAALLLAFVLAGCERSVFQSPPAAAQDCDAALVGRWLSQDDTPDDEGELEAIVDAQCRLVTIERKQSGPRRSEPTALHNARVGGTRYLWLDAAWANRSFEVEPNLLDRDGDVYLFAYKVERDRLRLDAPPHRALAQRVLAGDIQGDVLQHGEELTVRVEGNADAVRKLLAKYRLYRFDEKLTFRRAGDGDAQ
jgi:hypothetical protein